NEGYIVKKEDCVGHIQKRMCTRLRNLAELMKEKKLEDGRSLMGRGRLTKHFMNARQTFYGIAIRSNKGNVPEMSRQTIAAVKHYASTSDNPQH
ncbi:uncharacterized protein LOC144359941, partial [Saccoglossus kowalevskii]